jgi:hypothetical protein
MSEQIAPDLILYSGEITTLARSRPAPEAVAIEIGRLSAVCDAAEILPTAGRGTRVTNLGGRDTALRILAEDVTWFSNEEGKRGGIEIGQLADLAVLERDFFRIPGEEIQDISSMLAIVGGRIVHGASECADLAPPPPPAMPDWSPVRTFGGYQNRKPEADRKLGVPIHMGRCCDRACGVHGHDEHAGALAASTPARGDKGFWGALGCSCRAF